MRVYNMSGALLGLDINVGATTALVALSSHNLIVVSSKLETKSGPGVEVILHSNRTSDALALADGPVLLESACAIDRGLVGTGRDINVVVATVSGKAAFVLSTAAGVVSAKRLDHIVLDKGRSSPAVDSKVAVALRVEASAIVDGTGSAVNMLRCTHDSLGLTGQCQGSSPFRLQSYQCSAT